MSYHFSILNSISTTCLLWIVIYTIWNYSILSEGEGWGIVAIFGILVIIFIAVIINLILQVFIKDPLILNLVEVFVIILGLILSQILD